MMTTQLLACFVDSNILNSELDYCILCYSYSDYWHILFSLELFSIRDFTNERIF